MRLSYSQLANTATPLESAGCWQKISKSHYHLLVNRSGIGQNTSTMKRYSLFLGFIIGTTCSTLPAQDKVDLQPNGTVLSILQSSTGKTVELRLQAGEKIWGKVEQVTDNIIHLSHLTGAEFFDAFVNAKDISAVVIRTGGK